MTRIAHSWPGKSRADGARHPAIWHMLDVAAVAKLIFPKSRLGLLPVGVQNALLLLIALHDCGKISDAFRRQIEHGQVPAPHNRHWQLSYHILQQHDALIDSFIGGSEITRRFLYAAVSGHHGRPPVDHAGQSVAIGPAGSADAALLIGKLAPLFAPASLADVDEADAVHLSWLVSGLTVQADWIGSNDA